MIKVGPQEVRKNFDSARYRWATYPNAAYAPDRCRSLNRGVGVENMTPVDGSVGSGATWTPPMTRGDRDDSCHQAGIQGPHPATEGRRRAGGPGYQPPRPGASGTARDRRVARTAGSRGEPARPRDGRRTAREASRGLQRARPPGP